MGSFETPGMHAWGEHITILEKSAGYHSPLDGTSLLALGGRKFVLLVWEHFLNSLETSLAGMKMYIPANLLLPWLSRSTIWNSFPFSSSVPSLQIQYQYCKPNPLLPSHLGEDQSHHPLSHPQQHKSQKAVIWTNFFSFSISYDIIPSITLYSIIEL